MPVDTIWAALIAAAGTIAGAAVPVLAQWRRDRHVPFFPIISDRQRAVAGAWEGVGGDDFVENGQPPVQLKARFTIKLSGSRILADCIVTAESLNSSNHLSMEGGFFNQNLIQLMYRSEDAARIQYGVVLLQLTAAGDCLKGNYAGFSPSRECLIAGRFDLRRIR